MVEPRRSWPARHMQMTLMIMRLATLARRSSRGPVRSGRQQMLLRLLVGESGGGHGAVTSNSNSAPKVTPVTQSGHFTGAGV